MRSFKVDIINDAFQPLDEPHKKPAHLLVATNDVRLLVDEYHLLNTEIKRKIARRNVLREKISRNLLRPGVLKEKFVVDVSGRTVTFHPNVEYVLNEDEALKLFSERGLLDRVVKRVLTYKVKHSLGIKVAQRIWALLEKLKLSKYVEVSVEDEFDIAEIERMYELGELSDEDVDRITVIKPKGSGFRLVVEGIEEVNDDESD